MTDTFDVLDAMDLPQFRVDPQPLLRWLREEQPVHRTRLGFYLVSRHRDAWRVYTDTGRTFVGPDRSAPLAPGRRIPGFLRNVLLARNPPDHTRLRRAMAASFTPRAVRELRGRIEEICDRLLEEVAGELESGAQVDLHEGFSEPLTIHVISTLLGVDEADRDWLASLVLAISEGFATADEQVARRAEESFAAAEAYFESLIRKRKADPGDDLISALAGQQELEDNPLTSVEVVESALGLWIAGFASTAASIDVCVLHLLEHPQHGKWLSGGREPALAYADEVTRMNGGPLIFAAVPRIAVEDVELSGVLVPAGSDVRPVSAAANRDPEVFAKPDEFDPGRDNSRTLVYGAGIHNCLGGFLAREQMAIAMPRIHERLPDVAGSGAVEWSAHGRTRTILRLPVALDRSATVR
jgi:cytochrome P450